MTRPSGPNSKPFEFRCSKCGEVHRGSPSFSYAEPIYCLDVPEAERGDRITISDDLCRILPAGGQEDAGTIYCIRTTLDIPIHGAEEPFCWGVWVTQSKDNFDRYVDTFSEDQSSDGSFGWLAVTMPHYKTTGEGDFIEHLECNVEWGAPGRRPKVLLHESSHPLSVDQRNGIEWEKAVAIASQYLHGR